MKNKLQYAAGLVTFTLVLPAAADVIYSGYQNISIATNFTGVSVTVAGGTINPFFGGAGVANNANFQAVRSGTGGLDPILNLAAGTTINASSSFYSSGAGGSQTHLGTGSGQFIAGTDGYLGMKLSGTNYGWMRVDFTNNTSGAAIRDWAYDNTNGAAITVGNIVQSAPSAGNQTVTLTSDTGKSFTLGTQITNSLGNSGGVVNSVVKNGAGTAVLTGTNSYTGSTTVNSGRLVVNGNISTSLTTVKSGASLGGSGTVAATTVESGGTIDLGSSVGNLTINGDLTLAGTYTWKLGALSTASPNYDTITMTAGNADITSATLGLNLGSYAPSADTFWLSNHTWDGILNNTGAGTLTGNFAPIDNTTWSSLGSFTTVTTGSSVNLLWTAVPEPDVAALLGGIGTLLLLRRRR